MRRPGCGCLTVLAILVLLAVIGALCSNHQKPQTGEPAAPPTGTESSLAPQPSQQKPAIDQQAELKKLSVKIDAQDLVDSKGRHKVVVWVFNNSAYMFDGVIHVGSVDVSGSLLGKDTIFVDLPSGKHKYAILWLKTWPGGRFEYTIVGSFKGPAARAEEGSVPLDEQATTKLQDYLRQNFGVLKVSWYNAINKVSVYKDETATVLVKPDLKPEQARTIAMAVLNADITGVVEIKGVLVRTTDGTELCWVTK